MQGEPKGGEGRGWDPTPSRPPNPYFWIRPWTFLLFYYFIDHWNYYNTNSRRVSFSISSRWSKTRDCPRGLQPFNHDNKTMSHVNHTINGCCYSLIFTRWQHWSVCNRRAQWLLHKTIAKHASAWYRVLPATLKLCSNRNVYIITTATIPAITVTIWHSLI